MRIKKVVKKHSELLKYIKAFELLFDRRPKITYKGYAVPFGYSRNNADQPEYILDEEVTKVTTKYMYIKGHYDVPFLVEETEYNFVTLEG